jgi:hypothetical protein
VAHTFECSWEESGRTESRFYLPAGYQSRQGAVSLQPAGGRWWLEPAGEGGACYLVVPVQPGASSRTVTFTPKHS